MQTGIILGTIAFLYGLIFKGKIKLNFISIFLISLIAASFLYILGGNQRKISFQQFKTDEEVSEIWSSYTNHDLMTDVQVTRSLKPYKVSDESIVEPNSVVTDNDYIYSISNKSVVITNVSSLKVKQTLQYFGQDFNPILLYVTDQELIVIGETLEKTRVYMYHKNDFKMYKNYEVDSTYITSRLIEDDLFLVAARVIEEENDSKIRPSIILNGKKHIVSYQDIYYVNHTYANSFVSIIKTDIEEKEDYKMVSYLGLGQIVYFSSDNIYFAEQKYSKNGDSNKTILMRFDDDLKLSGLQEIKGYVLDQYSINEYNDYIRVATSTREDEMNKDSNHLFVLDKDMKIVGKLENFSQGNEIQASAFIKDKAYIETFNILDPFYVIDLQNVRHPKIISVLNFKGYNTNFIPMDKNHILAFGLILDEDKESIGIKVSIYDVTNPKDVKIDSSDAIMYKDYNSAYTDVLYDNKSLLLENVMLGFPIIYWLKDQDVSYYKQFYVVYDIQNGMLKKMGNISHYEKGNQNELSVDIKRGIVIKDKLYTVSEKKIKVHEMDDLKFIMETKLY